MTGEVVTHSILEVMFDLLKLLRCISSIKLYCKTFGAEYISIHNFVDSKNNI